MYALDFWNLLKKNKITFLSGVPDSTFKNIYKTMPDISDIKYIAAVREDVALGIASTAHFTNQLGCVIMQNSGIGNIINPLTSFNLIYKIPVLLLIGWRGFGGPPNDAPEHWIMGEKTTDFFELLNMPYRVAEADKLESDLSELIADIQKHSIPGALIVRKGVIQK